MKDGLFSCSVNRRGESCTTNIIFTRMIDRGGHIPVGSDMVVLNCSHNLSVGRFPPFKTVMVLYAI